MLIEILVFWDLTPFQSVRSYRRFDRINAFIFRVEESKKTDVLNPEIEGSTVGNYTPGNTASFPGRIDSAADTVYSWTE
jgi:hypothetical protein